MEEFSRHKSAAIVAAVVIHHKNMASHYTKKWRAMTPSCTSLLQTPLKVDSIKVPSLHCLLDVILKRPPI